MDPTSASLCVLSSSVPAGSQGEEGPSTRHLRVDDKCIQMLQCEGFTVTEQFHFRVGSRAASGAVQGIVSM